MESSTELTHRKRKKRHNEIFKIIGAATIVIIACGLSFFAGISYQKKHQTNTLAKAYINSGPLPENGQGMMGGGRGMRQNGIIGTVTAVSSTSISANDARSGSESTKTINSSTTISNNGANATVNDINVGDQVLIQTSSSDASIATAISINPSMPSGGPNSSPEFDSNLQVN